MTTATVGVVGFERTEVSTYSRQYNGQRRQLSTVVVHPTVPKPASSGPSRSA